MQLDFFEQPEQEPVAEAENVVKYKECKCCKKTMPHTKEYFGIASSAMSGKVHLKGICTECDNKSMQIRSRLRKEHQKDKGDTCDCCGKESDTLKLDHCYETGLFRGWLCHSCNTGIGSLGDNIEGLELALEYMKRHYDGQP